eukprot:CAMPEP_0197010444 /NCGR_PEP_ID=MMETSP1380-20130617/54308_1 /TAXON_ID=5936 /ORGANISM="Euplotes crassus, Strain CT5" /LENGTH=371 /DNA_ID=CAMNT_0042432365 /DNA_START=56 /DNA_END=1172 /DNA_ORIENTATION=+
MSGIMEMLDKDGLKSVHYLSQNTMDTSESTQENLSKYEIHQLIGRGSYAKVFLVSRCLTGEKYAMKVLKKCEMECKRDVKRVFIEKDIIQHLDHPFIVKLYSTFQTKDKAYFILDLLSGGDIYSHIMKEKHFTEERARFYAAEMVLALGHLHDNEIVYRDLKPQNIVIDNEGHVKLTDLDSRRRISSRIKNNTICGTMKYIAPETISGEKYTYTIDWWSLGIILYRMLTGKLPHPTSINKRIPYYIINYNLPFKSELLSKPAYDLITKLCVRKPEHRLGAGGVNEIKAHPFFKEIDWEKLYNKEIEPPYIPREELHLQDNIKGGIEDTVVKSKKKGAFSEEYFKNFSFASPEVMDSSATMYEEFEEKKDSW